MFRTVVFVELVELNIQKMFYRHVEPRAECGISPKGSNM